jgi:hypothetical protein
MDVTYPSSCHCRFGFPSFCPPVASPNSPPSLFQRLATYVAAGKGLEYPPSFPAHLGADVIALTRDCCQPDPEKRPTATQAAERLGMFVAKMWIEERKQAGTWEAYKGAVAGGVSRV